MKSLETFKTLGGWVVAIVVGTIYAMSYLNSSSDKNAMDIVDLQIKSTATVTKLDTLEKTVPKIETKVDEVLVNVAAIRGALEANGIVKRTISTPPPPTVNTTR